MTVIQSFTNFTPTPVNQPLALNLSVSGELAGASTAQDAIRLRVSVTGELTGRVRFALSLPAPILNEISETAFQKRFYAARLTDDLGNAIDFESAQVDCSKGQLGKRISIRISKKDLSIVSPERTYTFEIGVRETLASAPDWITIVEDASLTERNFNLQWQSDSLVIGALQSLSNKLERYPLKNYIFYNSSRTEVKLSEIDKIFDQSGNYVRTEVRVLPNLTLYKIFDLYKSFCGFSALLTNIPNYELTRFDLNITSSYLDSLSGIIGAFSPTLFTNGDALYILDKSAAIPFDFEPRAITADEFSDWSVSIPEDSNFDGFLVSFVDSDSQADYYVDRLVQTREETGSFGSFDYTRTDINRTYRDWFYSEQPLNPVRTELIREVHSTYDNALDLIGREANDHVYDAQGKRTNSARKIESKVPNLGAGGDLALTTVREEKQAVFYQSDSRSTRRQFQSKTITQIYGLTSIDAENQYFGQDFRQDFLRAHKAGNLTADMTSEFGLLQTITETLTPLGNNQFEVRTQTTDHLRGNTENAVSEPKTGDASLNSIGGRQRQTVVLREGLTLTSRTGGRIEGFNLGEIPLQIGIPLVERIIERRSSRKQTGEIAIAGFDASLERGTFFRILDRAGTSFGIFLTEGYSLDIRALGDGVSIQTRAEVLEI